MTTRHVVQFSVLVLLTITLIFGCDFSSETQQTKLQTYSSADIAAKHNEAVSQALENLRSTKQKRGGSFELNRRTIETALQQTQTYAKLDQSGVTNKTMAEFKRHLREERGLSNKATEDLGVDDLHRADILSTAQMEYIDKIRGLDSTSEVRRVAKKASKNLGNAATIVKIYAATYYNSLSFWKNRSGEVQSLASDDVVPSKGEIDWSAVAGADAGGAAVGAIGGAWNAVMNGSATAGLTFGPQGAVITITGQAISGAVTVGASASIIEALSQWGE